MSNEVRATAKLKDENGNLTGEEQTATVDYNFGANLDEAVELFGADVVMSQFKQAATVSLQSVLRRAILSGADVVEAAANWKPGVKAPAKTAKEKIADQFSKLSEEERAALLEELTG